MKVKLKNLSRRMRSFNLEHPTFSNVEGENGVGKPEALTMLSREIVEVHEDALLCREVKAALSPRKGRPTLRRL
jgi:hypothetical protein